MCATVAISWWKQLGIYELNKWLILFRKYNLIENLKYNRDQKMAKVVLALDLKKSL